MLVMDEILIGEKVYISSKRAAKLTGYAKDYVGQLCREGRVPARLVGRGWYVLESAIQDHRFGAPTPLEDVIKEEQKVEETPEVLPKTWESPRYEASDGENLPSINRLRTNMEQVAAPTSDVEEKPAQNLEDSWQTWFSRIGQGETPTPTLSAPTQPVRTFDVEEELEKEVEVETDEEGREGEVHIPIHTIYDLPPQIVMPVAVQEIEENEPEREVVQTPQRRRGRRTLIATFQFISVIIALISASMAVIGSGYVDSYIISNSQAHIIAGVSLYNK